MKKALIIALLAIFTAGPVLADGVYRSKPSHSRESHKKSSSDKTCVACGIGNALVWLVKLPVRLVTATSVGLYELVTDQDFSGFEEGYYLI
jgi:hypothetical protein